MLGPNGLQGENRGNKLSVGLTTEYQRFATEQLHSRSLSILRSMGLNAAPGETCASPRRLKPLSSAPHLASLADPAWIPVMKARTLRGSNGSDSDHFGKSKIDLPSLKRRLSWKRLIPPAHNGCLGTREG